MAGAVASSTTKAYANATSHVWTAPSGIADGDRLYLISSQGNTGNGLAAITLSGFSLLYSGFGYKAVDDFSVGLRVWGKVASGESGNYTADSGGTTTGMNGIMMRITGIDAGSPIIGSPTVETGTGASVSLANMNGQAVLTGDLVIYACAAWDTMGPATAPAQTPPTLTERYDPGASNNFYEADGVLAAGGNLTTYTQTSTNGVGNPWAGIILPLRADTGATGHPAAKRMGGVRYAGDYRMPGTVGRMW